MTKYETYLRKLVRTRSPVQARLAAPVTCRDGHFPPRLFLRKKRDTAPKLCALTARMVVGANSVRPFVHQTNLYYLHNICMLCKPFSASFLHDKKHRPNSSDGVIFFLVLQICILHKALINLTGNISALSDSPYYK